MFIVLFFIGLKKCIGNHPTIEKGLVKFRRHSSFTKPQRLVRIFIIHFTKENTDGIILAVMLNLLWYKLNNKKN